MAAKDRNHNWTKADALAWLHNEKSPAGREDARRLCRQLGAETEMRAARRKDWSRQVTTILDGGS